jgi:hypothetical protein
MASNVLLSMQKMIKKKEKNGLATKCFLFREDVYRNPTITIEYCEEDFLMKTEVLMV